MWKAPPAVVDQVQQVGVLLGPANHLHRVSVLEPLVVAQRLEVQPEVYPFVTFPCSVKVGCHTCHRV